MRRWKSKFALVFVIGVCVAQTPVPTETPAVDRVAGKLACTCGCNLDMNCKMEPWPCHICRPAREKILGMQKAGMGDAAILADFVKENGQQILIVEPGVFGSLSHYIGLGIGLLLVIWYIRRRRAQPSAAPGVDPALLERYHDRIEKEVEKLD